VRERSGGDVGGGVCVRCLEERKEKKKGKSGIENGVAWTANYATHQILVA
jgi:hypothetical protein